jgi:hypothetical protein
MKNIFESLYQTACEQVEDPDNGEDFLQASLQYRKNYKRLSKHLTKEQRLLLLQIVDDVSLMGAIRNQQFFQTGFRLCLDLLREF